MYAEELHKTDDEHHGGILDVDDEVVAHLRQDIAESLREDDAGHGLHMGHADGLGPLGLARVNGQDATPYRLGHVGAGVDGHHDDGGQPQPAVAPEHDLFVGEEGQAVVDKHRLEHHGGAPEDLHVDADDHADQLEEKPLDDGIALGIGDGVEDATQQPDHTADDGGHHR